MSGMFRLPWSTEPQLDFCDKMQLAKSRQVPLTNYHKRKRTDSVEALDPACKKSKVAREVQPVAVNSSLSTSLPDEPAGSNDQTSVTGQSKVKSEPTTSLNVLKEGVSNSITSSSATQPVAEIVLDTQPCSATDMEAPLLTKAQRKIEAHFNLEILMKHQELRLIEQELAKAQIALEQIRRCQLIPFPGTNGPTENVSNGTGSTLRPQPGFSKPSHPAPWGVADGPYSKHYAKWLISDTKFDSVLLSSLSNGVEGRSTRASYDPHSGYGSHHVGSKARMSRNSTTGLKLHSLGEHAAPVPKVDPLLHKRSTDGKWVRLYCEPCGHSNFSNTQGFLNHCRIKHQLVFKSHDAAAIAVGVPVDSDEVGSQVPPQSAVTASTPVATPVTATLPPTAFAPPSATLPTPTASFASNDKVHWLIKSDAAQPAKPLPPRRATEPTPLEMPRPMVPKSVNTLMTPNVTPGVKRTDYFSTPASGSPISNLNDGSSFIPSPQTPHLNSLFQKAGMTANLKDAVAAAKVKVDLSAMETVSDDELSPAPHAKEEPQSQQMARLPSRGGMGPASQRPASKKGQATELTRGPTHRAPTALNLGATPSLENSDSRVIPESPVELSPHTLESNPGLVSDDDDEDDEDDNCSVSHLDRDVDMVHSHHPIVVDDGSDAECDRRKGMEGFKKAGSSQKQ